MRLMNGKLFGKTRLVNRIHLLYRRQTGLSAQTSTDDDDIRLRLDDCDLIRVRSRVLLNYSVFSSKKLDQLY